MEYKSCKICGFIGCWYLEKTPENNNTECCFCGPDKLEPEEACKKCKSRQGVILR